MTVGCFVGAAFFCAGVVGAAGPLILSDVVVGSEGCGLGAEAGRAPSGRPSSASSSMSMSPSASTSGSSESSTCWLDGMIVAWNFC